MEIKLTREVIEVKHQVLQNRINETYNKLKDISIFVECENEIKSIELIKEQYEKMYKAILEKGEYDKYKEVEDFIISKLAKVEKAIDKIIYRTAKKFDEILQNHIKTSRESEEYKKFQYLDEELNKIKQLKALFKYCKIYFSRAQETQINTEISTFKFELLIRRQIQQMIYQNGTVHDGKNLSRLHQNDSQEEADCFCALLEKMMEPFRDDEVLKKYKIGRIARDNILLNHLLFRILEQDIETNPEKYEPLLEAKIFNPHMCNIANNPFTERVPYLEGNIISPYSNRDEYIRRLDDPYRHYYKRDKANLSLLRAVLQCAIKKGNTTIMECENIYQRFGFECNPIVVSEGQEIVRRVFEKTKHKLKHTEQPKEITGQYAEIIFKAYDYKFDPKEEPYFTYAQMKHMVENKKWQNEDIKQRTKKALGFFNSCMEYEYLYLSDMQILANLREHIISGITGQSNEWRRYPLEGMGDFKKPERPQITRTVTYLGFEQYKTVDGYDETELWKSYESDFDEMGIRIKEISHETTYAGEILHTIAISLDDIAGLPIDFNRIHILSKKEIYKLDEQEGR